ncbi:uncharacterized protein PITG_04881 [Phytophthora infestans T30-4]|uniref:Uncharacterized protein n=1 Tax=Phytophthora infestans (strain T30-4) TaxID=403677 RepID=D0N296_PHYIT|nr:uncharacterized protein PITG_04881 [Phytophthora infestans T30-4]EEY68425.1 conserved hypothetical protein [Phytophthora infestans T30-4]|eukprot:XP_002905584.1 conserved hypothetical protein [Phytophthora infestans T30-4]
MVSRCCCYCQRLLELLDDDEAFQALVREISDLRQLDQLIKTKAKDGTHTLELPDVTVQWQVAEEPGLPSVLQRVQDDGDSQSTTGRVPSTTEPAGKYRPLPVRKLVVAVWMYPPHVEIPPTGDRIPVASDANKQDFFRKDDAGSVEGAEETNVLFLQTFLEADQLKSIQLSMPIVLLQPQEQVMGCVAGTEQHGDTAFQSSGELRGVLRWGGLRSTNLIIGIVINIIGHTLHSRKSKQPIHVFGFGDSQTADQCVFTFSPTEVRVEVWSTSCGIQTSPRILC